VARNPITGIAGCCARAASGHGGAEKGDEFAALHHEKLLCKNALLDLILAI
jgi:hypothetical protein